MDKISTILVPFDFSETAQKALGYVAEFTGRNDDIQIVLAHISKDGNFKTPPERIKELEEKYHAVLKNKLEWVTRDGTLTDALLDIRKTKEIDLVIMGTHGTHREETNTSKLVMAAECPVLVIPVDYQGFSIKAHRPGTWKGGDRRTWRLGDPVGSSPKVQRESTCRNNSEQTR